jgi:hypothetical protein
MKKPLLLAASGFAGLAFGFAGCGDDKENGGGTSTTFPTVSTGTTEGTTTGFTTTGEDEGTTTGEDKGGSSGKGGGGDDDG